MDNYECSTTALKIPFYPLGLRFPAGDVLDAVILNWTINFSRRDCLLPPVSFPLSPFSFSPFLSLFSQSLFSTSLPMPNDQ